MRIIRLISSIVILLSAFFFAYCFFNKKGIFAVSASYDAAPIPIEKEVKIGGDFSLVNQDGQIVHSRDFKDKYMMVFFGFSSCKKVCPMNLGILSEVLIKLDKKINEKLKTFFITVDPERDSIERLKEFHQQFDHRIQMLTGNKEEIGKVITNYKVYTSKVTGEGEEEINHSSIIYLIGPKGRYLTHFVADLNSEQSQSDKIISEIRKYISKL